jgi:hypothetical protein
MLIIQILNTSLLIKIYNTVVHITSKKNKRRIPVGTDRYKKKSIKEGRKKNPKREHDRTQTGHDYKKDQRE